NRIKHIIPCHRIFQRPGEFFYIMNKRRVGLQRCTSLATIVACIILANTRFLWAYDNDTHFWFTYYLSIRAGYTPIQAAQIASADVIVDFDDDTQPVMPSIENLVSFRHPLQHFQYIRNRLHALPTRSEVRTRAYLDLDYRWDPVIVTDPK